MENNKQEPMEHTIDDYSKFKKLLEYFVAHLEVYNLFGSIEEIRKFKDWNELRDAFIGQYPNCEKKINALRNTVVELKDFKWSGQSFRSGNIDKQISQWSTYSGFMRIGISIALDNFSFEKKNIYLHWLMTAVNIKVNGRVKGPNDTTEDTIDSITLVNSNNSDDNTCTVSQLGLFDDYYGDEPNSEDQQKHFQCLKEFFNKYYNAGKNALDKMNKYVEILKDHKNLILTGAPGTGKSYLANQLARTLTNNKSDHIGFVQFHPSYDYTDFVEGLRPITQGNSIVFRWHAGHFMNFCQKAASDLENKYVFIIDEINRGEINKIFGELFFSIDPCYREENCRRPIYTQYADSWPDKINPNGYEDAKGGDFLFKISKGFYVPENVYIIGTMNDIDRSVESLDFAFRRRFAWEEISWEDTIGSMLGSTELELEKCGKIYDYFERLNTKISGLLGSEYCLGGSYLKKLNQNDVEHNLDYAMEQLWDRFLKIIIKDYIRGQENPDDVYKELYDAYFDRGTKDAKKAKK